MSRGGARRSEQSWLQPRFRHVTGTALIWIAAIYCVCLFSILTSALSVCGGCEAWTCQGTLHLISHTWLDARNKRLKGTLGCRKQFRLTYCHLSDVQTPSAQGACLQHIFPYDISDISQRYNRDTIQEISRRHFCSPNCLDLQILIEKLSAFDHNIFKSAKSVLSTAGTARNKRRGSSRNEDVPCASCQGHFLPYHGLHRCVSRHYSRKGWKCQLHLAVSHVTMRDARWGILREIWHSWRWSCESSLDI